jgi:hypothetical protein
MNKYGDIDQRTQELLNGGLDGELSPAEQEELNALLAKSAGARELDKEMRAINQLMDTLPELEPPHYLKETIERQVRLPVQDTDPDEKRGLFGHRLSANWLRTGFALAAGVVLTVGVYEMGSEPLSEQDSTHLVGTVVKPGLDELLDRALLANDSMKGVIELRQSDNFFTLDVQLDSDGPTEVVLNFAQQGFEFEGIEPLVAIDDIVSVTDGAVSVTGGGEQHYKLKLQRNLGTLEQQTSVLGLKLFANNGPVQEVELRISRQ